MKIDEILNTLPTREDLAAAVGLHLRKSLAQEVATALGVFGTGMLLGAGLGLILAPKAGSDLRHDLMERLNEIKSHIANGKDESNESVADRDE